VLAHAELVVIAAGYASRALAEALTGRPLPLQPIRGQVSFGLHNAQADRKTSGPAFPATPVNGNGSLIPAVPMAGGSAWLSGSSYERDCAVPEVKPNDHRDNLERLQVLLPLAATEIENALEGQQPLGWSGIRCATPNRLPMLGPVAATASGAEVWICTGMGSRGLTFAALCAELLAAKLHGEPLPLEHSLARALALRKPHDQPAPGSAPAPTASLPVDGVP
jgi:tRNA 5-methylaminomethyl-2-thiouridine biosynthesis bifunctional protein